MEIRGCCKGKKLAKKRADEAVIPLRSKSHLHSVRYLLAWLIDSAAPQILEYIADNSVSICTSSQPIQRKAFSIKIKNGRKFANTQFVLNQIILKYCNFTL